MSITATTANTTLPLQSDLRQEAPHSDGIHRGWWILAMAAAGIFMSAPGQSYSVAAFIDPMLSELGLLRTEYSMAYLVATLLGGLTLPRVGRLVDVYGARLMLPIVAVLLGFACCWMANIQNLFALFVGFSLIRCLGQGTLTLVSTWLVGEWFDRRRGLAMGLVGLGGTFSVMVVPQLNDMLIGEYGWRNTWLILAFSVWVVLILPSLFVVRDRPEEMGLLPDWNRSVAGHSSAEIDARSADQEHRVVESVNESWTATEARRTAAFWKLLAVGSTSSLVGTGLVFHQVSLLGEQGVSRQDALGLLGVQAVVGTVMSLFAGYLTDRVQARFLLLASSLFLAMALGLLAILPSPGWAVVYAGLLGLQGGIIRSTGSVVWINFFGRLHQGSVRGLAMSVMVIAAAFGPLPLALSKDYLGSYTPVLCGFLALPLLAALGILTATQPVKNIVTSRDCQGAGWRAGRRQPPDDSA